MVLSLGPGLAHLEFLFLRWRSVQTRTESRSVGMTNLKVLFLFPLLPNAGTHYASLMGLKGGRDDGIVSKTKE